MSIDLLLAIVWQDGHENARSFGANCFSQLLKTFFTTISTNSRQLKQPRKYLGDPHDPHFIPKSPIIERPKISEKDEAELRRMCALALANVPHSDDMTDDPFRYLAKHITAKAPQALGPSEEPTVSAEGAQAPVVFPTGPAAGDDTATPSETSKRETLQSNTTTPMTSPGITPGETGKRFSEAGRRPSTAAPSTLRTEVKTFKANAVYSFLKDPPPMARPQTAATKSLTHLPSFIRVKSKQSTPEQPVHTKATVISRPDFNKSLPAIPKPVNQTGAQMETAPKEKSGAITRMLKTVRLQRTQTPPVVQVRSTSTDAPRQPEQLDKLSGAAPAKKQRFNFSSMFHKRNSTHPKRLTVG